MKKLLPLVVLALVVVTARSAAHLAGRGQSPERSNMSKASFGNHSAQKVPRRLQETIRNFYRDVLGCEITTETSDIDFVRMGDHFFLTFLYQDNTLPEAEWSKSIWLEIRTDDVAAMRQKILTFGVKEVNSLDKAHLYFQAPGGQVFRLVGSDEDLSRFEK